MSKGKWKVQEEPEECIENGTRALKGSDEAYQINT